MIIRFQINTTQNIFQVKWVRLFLDYKIANTSKSKEKAID